MYLKCKNKLFFIFGDFRTKNYWQESKKKEKNGFFIFLWDFNFLCNFVNLYNIKNTDEKFIQSIQKER